MSANVVFPGVGGSLSDGLRILGTASPADGDRNSSDAELMSRYQRGDANAFEKLYRRHSDRVHRYVLRILTNAAEAEEVFQEVWIAVIRGSDRYLPSAKFITFLYSIAHRRALDRLRAGRRQSEDLIDEENLADPAQVGPIEIASRGEAGRALLDAIARLPVLQREAFLLQAEEGMSVEEIADVTGVNRETAKSRLRYASARLRKALQEWK